MPEIGLPRDGAQWLALGLALAVALAGGRLLRARAGRSRRLVLAAAGAAALLSTLYVALYLRGGPRIVDATSYWLEARALASGMLAWPAGDPEAATLGRFLVRGSEPGTVAVIFPPGYPAVLAAGFLAGAPMAIGPVLAAVLVVLTWQLARGVELDLGTGRHGVPSSVAAVAVLLSVVCAALRYHTADTMSHGLAAVCFAGAVVSALRIQDGARTVAWALACGACVGWLAATRPVSAIAAAFTVAVMMRGAIRQPRALVTALALLLATLPGLGLLVAHRLAATGSPWVSAQAAYYAVSDGPPGCFRYGFGDGIGCLGEHGDFVRARLEGGFGALAAAGVTLRRLKMHLVDAANLEPLALLVVAGAIAEWKRSRTARALGIAIAAQIAVYIPFYFDGNYPGGGGRFFADVLPFEHALVAVAACWLAERSSRWARAPEGVVALSLLGFAVRAGFDHASLRDREGGAPMFDRGVLVDQSRHRSRALVLVDTDHGWSLGHDPTGRDQIRVVRGRGDAIDWMAWDAAGRPPVVAYRYALDGRPRENVRLESVEMPAEMPSFIEGESLWPPRATTGAWSWPEDAAGTCASAERWLAVRGSGDVTVGLPARWLGGRRIRPRLAIRAARASVELVVDGAVAHATSLASSDLECALPPESWLIPKGSAQVLLRLQPAVDPGGLVALDRISISEGDETR